MSQLEVKKPFEATANLGVLQNPAVPARLKISGHVLL